MPGPGPGHGRQEAVLGALRLGHVEPADDPERRVGDDPALDLRGGLLGADEDDPEAPPALGDVEQDLLDRAPALARGVPVELVEDEEVERLAAAHPLLVLEEALDHHPGHEPLRPVVEVVDVDDRDLVRLPVDPVASGILGGRAPDEVADPMAGGLEPALEGGDRALGQPAAPAGIVVVELERDRVAQLLERADPDAVEADRGRCLGIVLAPAVEERLDPGDEVGDLGPLVVALGEQEAQVALADELADRPVVGGHALGPALDLGDRGAAGSTGATRARGAGSRRGPQPDRRERPDRQPEPLVLGPGLRSSSRAFGRSSQSRSSPLTLNTSAFVFVAYAPRASEWNRA